jgi:glycosyltransferase involved in cell wall biosynthesis
MTIFFLDQFSDLGGAQQCLLDLLPAVRDRGWRAVVAAPGDGQLLEMSSHLGASVERLADLSLGLGHKSLADIVRFGGGLPRWAATLRRLLAHHHAELLYVNGPRMLPIAAFGKRLGIPVIFHSHSYLEQGYASVLVAWSLRRCDSTLIASCQLAASALPNSRRHFVYNGVADVGFQESVRRPIMRVGVIGRVSPEKGQHVFVEAARGNTECRFAVIGSALFRNETSYRYFDEVRRRAVGLPVEFDGWTDDIASAMRALDLLVAPSTGFEATTRVIPEAWSAGVPVVASRIGGIAEIVEDGVTGFLVEPGSARALAERIAEVRAMPEDRLNAVRRAARRRYEESFTVERYRARIMEIIEGA